MADIFCGKILHSPSVGSKSPLCVYSSPCTVSYYLNVSIFHCNPHRHSRRCYLLHDRRYLASASSSNRLPSELDIISTAERSDGSVVFKFADASQIVKDVEHLDESEEKLSEETADRRRGADFVGDDTGLKNCSSNSVELAYDDSDQEHSEAVKSDAVEGEGAVDANSESNADVGEDNSMPEFAVSVVKATKISTYSELAQYGGNQEHSEVVESDNVAGRGAMDVKNEPNEKVDQGIGSLELAVSLVGTSRDSEVELAHNDSDRDHSEMVEGNSGMGRGAMDINNELAVSAVEAEGTSSAFEIELVRNESHLPSEIAESNDGAAKGSMDVKNELDEYTDPNTQISELVVSVVEAEETSVDSSVGLMSAHNFTEGSSGSGENRKADVSLTNILEDVEKSHRPDLNDHIYVAASSDDSVLEDAEVFCSEEASEDITGVQAIMPVASSSDELSAERLGCNESLDGGEQNSSVDTGADMSFLVKDDEADNVTAIMSEHSQSVVGLIPDLESITSDKSQCLVADNSSDILPRKSDVAAEISEFTERSAHKDLGTKSVESTISRGDGHLSDSILHSAAASLRNPSKELGSNRKIGSAKMCSGLYFFQPTKSIVAATSLSSPGGGDAYFLAGWNWFGVADGVGQWSLEGTQEGHYAFDLMKSCECAALNNKDSAVKSIRSVLRQSAAGVESAGAARVLLANFDTQVLHVANIGDTGFIILRSGFVVKRSCSMTHEFYFPLQIGTSDDPSEVVEEYHVDLDDGDVIVTATDGLFNNLYEQEIASVVSKSMAVNMTPKEIAELLAIRAKEVGESRSARTPFSDAAQAAGYVGYTGGKPDDVTVIVSLVQRR